MRKLIISAVAAAYVLTVASAAYAYPCGWILNGWGYWVWVCV